MQHDEVDEFAGWRVGFYRVEFQVPVSWAHIGLLPTWNPKEHRPVWPSRPSRYWYPTVVSADELRLAIEQQWPIHIRERWLFAEGDKTPATDPLKNWINKLRGLRDSTEDPLLKRAIRAICIKAIGGLHRKGRYQIVETLADRLGDIPEDAEIVWRTDSLIRWRRPIPLDPSMEQFSHPEMAAMIWGRARARLARAALSLPRECIISLRSDAMALTFDPGWVGTKPGEFRLKRVVDLDGRPLPRTTREYLDLLQDDEEIA
jgi:hypothetical protein